MPKGGEKAAAQKKIEDKMFGMKNKKKSKAIQGQIANMKKVAGLDEPHKDTAKMKKQAADAALNDVLFKEALTLSLIHI